ncbi:MAG: metallopeptidase family protein [Actinomycetota bacterium]|nr:metallopeptidase family protein [Actinomycetota bacterium]
MDLTPPRFEELVEEALEGLPAWIRERLENVEIIVEERSDRRGLLGLYEGIPLTERGMNYTWVLPDRITLFQRNIEREARTEDNVPRVVADTVIHEIAHFFGISEDRLRELGRD